MWAHPHVIGFIDICNVAGTNQGGALQVSQKKTKGKKKKGMGWDGI